MPSEDDDEEGYEDFIQKAMDKELASSLHKRTTETNSQEEYEHEEVDVDTRLLRGLVETTMEQRSNAGPFTNLHAYLHAK